MVIIVKFELLSICKLSMLYFTIKRTVFKATFAYNVYISCFILGNDNHRLCDSENCFLCRFYF